MSVEEKTSAGANQAPVKDAAAKSSGWLGQIMQLAGVVAVVFLAKGAIAEPVYVPSGSMEPTLLIGNGPTDLHRITMIGYDLALDSGIGTCGMNGQGVPVGVGQPTLRMERITVGGTGG